MSCWPYFFESKQLKKKLLLSEICHLKSLEELWANGCSNIDKLPENLGKMKCLKELYFCGTAIRQLPFSVVGFENLKHLFLGGCGS